MEMRQQEKIFRDQYHLGRNDKRASMLTLEQKSTHSPKDDQAVKVAKHRINKGGYLYKNIEEKYLKTVEEVEKEKIEKILEERHKLMQNPTISV